MRAHILGIALVLCACHLLARDTSIIHSVSASRPFFNPTLGQKVDFSFNVGAEGLLTVSILDRDGFLVRRLASKHPVRSGAAVYTWDGRDDQARVVPDEAYSAKVDLEIAGKTRTSFPANLPSAESAIQKSSYDRQSAILSYQLPAASRVYIEAASSNAPGRVLANWEPRSAGSVIERWNGYDAAGKTYLPDSPGFSISLKARPLPEGSIIAIGNAAETYAQYVSRRPGSSLLPRTARSGMN